MKNGNYNSDRKMEKLMEPAEMSEEIIGKLATDYIRRYQLKQQFQGSEFCSDTNRLIAELQLYSRTIRQLAGIVPQRSPSLDQNIFQTIFRVIQFLARYVQKFQTKAPIQEYLSSRTEMICEGCSLNLNAKKIEVLRRQMFQSFPLLGKQDLEETQQNVREGGESSFLLGNDQTINKIVTLQRNLHEKQLGLMRIIDEFQDFRSNLLVGLPKNHEKGFEDSFNTKEYAFNLGLYFSNNLRNIEEKITNLKAICKKTEDREVQCNIKEPTESQKQKTVQAETTKIAAMRAEAEIRKLHDIRIRLEENAKIYAVEIQHLNGKLGEVEEQNRTLKHEMFVEKFKLKAKSKGKGKQSYPEAESQSKAKDSPRKTSSSSIGDLDIANEMLNQLNQRRSQMQSNGIRIEEAFPFFKSTFKRALDHFISHRGISNLERKRLFRIDSEEDIGQSSKEDKKLEKGTVIPNKKQFIGKFEATVSRMHQRNFLKIYNNQVNYKIAGPKKKSTRHLSSHDDKYEKYSNRDNVPKEPSRFLYKRSTLQTEGGNNLKKRGLKVKLSSLSSDVKDQPSFDGASQKDVPSHFNPQGQFANADSIKSDEYQSLPKVAQRELSDIFEAGKCKGSKSKTNFRHLKNGSLTTLIKPEDLADRQNIHNLIQIKKIHHKTMAPQVLSNFFEPSSERLIQSHSQKQKQKDSSLNIKSPSSNGGGSVDEQARIQQNRHARMKEIFNNIKSLRKSQAQNSDPPEAAEKSARKRKTKKKETLTLEELSYVTAFFTLMAQAHLSNEPLYSQLKVCTFECSKENKVAGEEEQTMVRETVRDIILKHRKCSRSQSICKHLSEFLISFNACLQE